MTPNEITSLIASNLNKELDLPFRLQLMERVKVWRSRLIANSIQKIQQQRKFFKQTIYMRMQEGNNTPCAALVGCPVAITTDDVPMVVRVGNQMFDFIGSVNGSTAFIEAQPGMQQYQNTGRFSKEWTKYERINDKILVAQPDLPWLRIDAIFDDPMKILEYNCTCSAEVAGSCDVWDTQFPVSGDIMQLVIQSILQVDYGRMISKEETEIPVK
jgi:hypothetical protein